VSLSAMTRTIPRAFAITPTPGHQTRGTARIEITPNLDVILEVSVQGPVQEISRPNGGPNVIWHIATGICATWRSAAAQGRNPGNADVLYRFVHPPDRPDAQNFELRIRRDLIDGRGLRTPAVLVAFRNGGGGPLYACGDIPDSTGAAAPAPVLPRTGEPPVLGVLLAGLLLLGSGLGARRPAR
jgi:hypothetical protein